MTITLFIGGCADGKRLDIDGRVESFRVAKDAEPLDFASGVFPEKASFEVDNYRRTELRSGHERYAVMLHDREPCVMAALLRGYRTEAQDGR